MARRRTRRRRSRSRSRSRSRGRRRKGKKGKVGSKKNPFTSKAKAMRQPWEIGKAFERSAPVGPIHPIEETGQLNEGLISLKVNGVLKQEGNLNQMIWKVPEIISFLSDHFELTGGDVILTGTPSGVSQINVGDLMEAYCHKLGSFQVKVL